MATIVWEGQSTAVAQVTTYGVTGYDAATTYSVAVGGETITSIIAAGTAAATVSGLATAWNAVTDNPYATTITASVTGVSLKLTADVAGNPFTMVTTATGGTGAWGTAVAVTANAGPNDWDTAANWSTDTVPVAADDVVFRDSGVSVYWGLDQAAVDLTSLIIEQSFTGVIGLARTAFVTGADGSTSELRPEYRQDYLDVGWTTCRIGESHGPGSPAGSSRLKLDNDKAGASTTEIFDTGSSSADANLPAVRLLAANASADVYIRSAPGGVGLAMDDPTETTTIGDLEISDDTPASRVFVGEGVTLSTYTQQGGINSLRAAADVTAVTVKGGDLTMEGDGWAATTLTVEAGTVYANHTDSPASLTTVNLDGGTLDGTQSRRARTWSTVNLRESGSTLRIDPNVVTITTLNDPADAYTLTVD